MRVSLIKIFRSSLEIVTEDLVTGIGLADNNMQVVAEGITLRFPRWGKQMKRLNSGLTPEMSTFLIWAKKEKMTENSQRSRKPRLGMLQKPNEKQNS